MINELYQLSVAMEQAGITAQSWHRKYKPIPNISEKAPCFRMVVSGGTITEISAVEKTLGSHLRKYGSNQGTFPACNLAPLYRVTDEAVKKKLHSLQLGKAEMPSVQEARSWCVECNWGKKFRKKYAISMKAVPEELYALLKDASEGQPMLTLLQEAKHFAEPQPLFNAIEAAAFQMIAQKKEVGLALSLLFYAGSPEKSAEDDTGALSVIFDCEELIEEGIPSASVRFTQQLNRVLLSVSGQEPASVFEGAQLDAFGIPFAPLEEPMPSVKLAGGFETVLRTMFGANLCQFRYGAADNASYPISPQKRQELQAALNWIGDKEHQYRTWINTDKDEILFVYPYTLPKTSIDFVRIFKHVPNSANTFEKEARALIDDLRGLHPEGAQAHADRLQVFILRKMDKARTKVLYTRMTDPAELKERANCWSRGCANLPSLPFGQPQSLFPMNVADVLNRVWKQDGTLATDKFKPVPHYRGMELLMEPDEPVTQDLSMLAKAFISLAPLLGALNITDRAHSQKLWWQVKEMLALCGLLLDRLQRRKESYMEDFPFQYGQLLKVSDELHALYGKVVRNNKEIPPQLAGSSLVQSATEFPIRTLVQLGQRMMPYWTWAKSYQYRQLTDAEKAKEQQDDPNGMLSTRRAGWLLYLYEGIVAQLRQSWSDTIRLNDAEKAQLLLGYLAALPRKKKPDGQAAEAKEETIDVNEEEDHAK